jgi:hypothetical protein
VKIRDDYIQDYLAYECARLTYLDTENMAVRHVMENVMVRLLRKGVKPAHDRD